MSAPEGLASFFSRGHFELQAVLQGWCRKKGGTSMALKLQFKSREEIPAGQESFYVERDGAWCLDVEEPPLPASGQPLPSGERGEPRVLPKPEPEKPREQRTLRDEMAVREAHVAQMALESNVREAARRLGASAKVIEELIQRARCEFRIWEGRAVPVAGDGRTVLLSGDGSRALSVEEWAVQKLATAEGAPQPKPDAVCEDGAMPRRNPFRKKSWNLTEQMKLRKADPAFAAKLKAAAWQEEG
jgi:hypothetical protein